MQFWQGAAKCSTFEALDKYRRYRQNQAGAHTSFLPWKKLEDVYDSLPAELE